MGCELWAVSANALKGARNLSLATHNSPPMNSHPATRLLRVERDGNPLRRYGYAAPYIGKLGPLDGAKLDGIGQLTRAALPDLPQPTLVIGMTESSLLLAFWMALWQQKPVDLRFTSRKIRQGNARKISFREPHSHGPQHYLALERGARYAQIVIIEDELTTGATLRNLIVALEGVSERVFVATLRDMRPQNLRDELQTELAARGVNLQVIALDSLHEDLPVEETPLCPQFNPFGRAPNDYQAALCELEKQWPTFAPDQIYLIGECVDIALQWWLHLPLDARPELRQITRSPWKVDGKAVLSREAFAAPNQKSRYFLYNFAPPENGRVLWMAEKCNASVGALVSDWFAQRGIEARGIEVAGT